MKRFLILTTSLCICIWYTYWVYGYFQELPPAKLRQHIESCKSCGVNSPLVPMCEDGLDLLIEQVVYDSRGITNRLINESLVGFAIVLWAGTVVINLNVRNFIKWQCQ